MKNSEFVNLLEKYDLSYDVPKEAIEHLARFGRLVMAEYDNSPAVLVDSDGKFEDASWGVTVFRRSEIAQTPLNEIEETVRMLEEYGWYDAAEEAKV